MLYSHRVNRLRITRTRLRGRCGRRSRGTIILLFCTPRYEQHSHPNDGEGEKRFRQNLLSFHMLQGLSGANKQE